MFTEIQPISNRRSTEKRPQPKRLKLKYKPRDFKEALLLKRLEEGDKQFIRQITYAELSSHPILVGHHSEKSNSHKIEIFK